MAFTFFFRDYHTLKLIEQHVIPQLKTKRYLKIWDAGCAHGPEPYSLAMVLRENMGQFLFRNVQIIATDHNGRFGETIREGIYPEEQVKRIPEDIFEKYFEPAEEAGQFRVIESIRRAVSFKEHDLTSLYPIGEDFGLIMCKNVLLHLSPEQRVNVFRMFRDALSKDGFLATEQTQKLPEEVKSWFNQTAPDGQVFQRALETSGNMLINHDIPAMCV